MTQTAQKKRTELLIHTADDLLLFARAINKLHNKQQRDLMVTLTNDIDLTGVEWTPIGNEDIPFYGTFDGAGHTISGLHIDKNEGGCCDLFGVCAGTIENLTVTGSITCVAADVHSAVGGIAGLVVGGHISNCAVDIVIDSNHLSLGMYAGGVVGKITEGTIRGCRSSAKFENVLGNFIYLGGVVGAAMDARVAHCVFDGSIQVLGGPGYYIDAGGVVGNVQGHSTVVRCLNAGLVDAYEYDFDFSIIGGVVGHIDGDGVILESVNRGSVSGGCKAAGGIAGWIVMDHQGKTPLTAVDCCLNLGDVIQSPNSPGGSCGGIVGEIYNKPLDTAILVRNCVCLGSLILRDPAGRAHPITAHADGAIFENNYFDQRLSVQGEGVPQEQVTQGCTARPAAELLTELPERDNRYIIGPDGALTVRNLELGAAARKEEL